MASRDPAQPEKKVAADAAHASVQVSVERWAKGQQGPAQDEVAEEFPIALVYHAVPHVVMLATPADLEDYAVGFTLSEGLVAKPEEIRSVEVEAGPHAIDVRISIAWERFSALLQQRRNLTGRTGCGLCGAETVEQAIRTPAPLTGGVKVSSADLHTAMQELASLQPLNARTGSVHAAAWVLPGHGIRYVREDVGRHNALDKVIGAVIRGGEEPATWLPPDHEPRELRDGAEERNGGSDVPGCHFGADIARRRSRTTLRPDSGGLRTPGAARGV